MASNIYPIATEDRARALSDARRAGFTAAEHPRIMARTTGEKRPPKAGEWFLSGAIPEAYKTRADLTTPFEIVELVTVKVTTSYNVVGIHPLREGKP